MTVEFEMNVLNLGNNNLATIPEEVCNLRYLQILDLSENDLQEIPPNFKNLTQLKVLDLSDNEYLNVEQALQIISNLVGLEELNISKKVKLPTVFDDLKIYNDKEKIAKDLTQIYRRG